MAAVRGGKGCYESRLCAIPSVSHPMSGKAPTRVIWWSITVLTGHTLNFCMRNMRGLRTAIANATMRHYLNAIRENESSVAVVPSTYDGQKVIDTETQIKTVETLNAETSLRTAMSKAHAFAYGSGSHFPHQRQTRRSIPTAIDTWRHRARRSAIARSSSNPFSDSARRLK